MGLKVYAADPVDSVTAVVVPATVDEAALRKTMRQEHGFQIAGGQGDLKGKIVRFSHMGYVDAFDTLGVIAALELALASQGFDVVIGSGVSAAQKVFAEVMA
jgi:aspartate aminotransferase-like enzyme